MPAGTPGAIVSRLNAETGKVMALPEVTGPLRSLGFDAIGGTPEQFGDHIRRDVELFTKLVKATGITAE